MTCASRMMFIFWAFVSAAGRRAETQLAQPPCAPPLPHHLHPFGRCRHGTSPTVTRDSVTRYRPEGKGRGANPKPEGRPADLAGVGIVTVHQLEAGPSEPRRATLEVVRRAFEKAGIEFIDENDGVPGFAFANPQNKRLKNSSSLYTAEIQLQGNRTCLARPSKPQVPWRNTGAGAPQAAPIGCRCVDRGPP